MPRIINAYHGTNNNNSHNNTITYNLAEHISGVSVLTHRNTKNSFKLPIVSVHMFLMTMTMLSSGKCRERERDSSGREETTHSQQDPWSMKLTVKAAVCLALR